MKRIFLLSLSLIIFGFGCTKVTNPPSSLETNHEQVSRVCALFDTQPNDSGPCWALTQIETNELIEKIKALPEAQWSDYDQPKLGYNGLQVFLPESNKLSNNSTMTIISIFNGNIFYNSDLFAFVSNVAYVDEPNPHMTYRQDPDKRIETWLLSKGEDSVEYEQWLEIHEAWVGTNRFVRASYSIPSELWVRGIEYDDMVDMSAMSAWEEYFITNDFSITIPYSPQWKIETRPVLPYNEIPSQQTGLDHNIFTFGKYVSGGTYVTREYTLDIQLDEKAPSEIQKTANECPDIIDPTTRKLLTPPPSTVTVGDITGVTYLSGGAKGCATVYEFTIPGKLTGSLHQWSGMGTNNLSHELTPDMKKIIENIRITTGPKTLSFGQNILVGIEQIEISQTKRSYMEKVYIENRLTGHKIYLDKPEALDQRPIDRLKKIDEQTFSFIITANPHYGQYFIYTIDGKRLEAHPVGDECYFADAFEKELEEAAKFKCLTHPEFGTLDELTEKLKN